MLNRTAHIIYFAALIAMAAVMVNQRLGDRSAPAPHETQGDAAAEADHLAMLATFNGLAQVQDAEFNAERRGERNSDRRSAPTANGNKELIDRALEVAREIDPQLGGRLATLHEKNPAAFERVMRHGHVGKNLFAMTHLKQRDPELYQIKLGEMMQTVQVNRAAAQLREAIRNNSQG